jgi:fatty-acyl-CoA synthase
MGARAIMIGVTESTTSYVHGASSTPLVGDTIGANLERIVGRFPDREAIVDCATGRRWTYREFDRDVDAVALGFLDLGIAKGDRVGLWATNCAEWTLVQFATAKIGAILVNINPAYRTHELEYALRQSGCRLLVAATDVKGASYVEMVDAVRGDLPALERALYVGRPEWDELLEQAGRVRPTISATVLLGCLPTTRSTSSTPRERRASRRARRCRTTTS